MSLSDGCAKEDDEQIVELIMFKAAYQFGSILV